MSKDPSNITYVKLSWFNQKVDDKFFRFSFPIINKNLQSSIEQFGLLQPLIIRGGDDRYSPILLCGHRRLQALRDLAIPVEIPVQIIPAQVLPLERALHLLVSENLAHREFNLVEKSSLLYYCFFPLNLPKEKVVHKWLPLLSLKPSRNLLASHLKILQLPPNCLKYIVENKLPLKTAHLLSKLTPETLEIFFPIMTRFQLGVNRIDEMINNLVLISKREEKSIPEILEEILVLPEVSTLLMGKEGDQPQKIELLRNAIRKRAYPTLNSMEDVFSHETKSLNLPNVISIKPPSFFEGDRIDVQFKFGSKEELRYVAEKLMETVDQPALKTILELL